VISPDASANLNFWPGSVASHAVTSVELLSGIGAGFSHDSTILTVCSPAVAKGLSALLSSTDSSHHDLYHCGRRNAGGLQLDRSVRGKQTAEVKKDSRLTQTPAFAKPARLRQKQTWLVLEYAHRFGRL
jgi:hypothetical protein